MEYWALAKFSLLWLIMVIDLMQGCSGCLEKERMGLLQIKDFFSLKGANESNTVLASWVDDRATNCCAWELVKCNPLTGHVAELSLSDLIKFSDRKHTNLLNVSLFLPFEELRSFDLSFNQFDALVEERGFSSLKMLEILNLSYNYFNSSIFASFNGLSTLRTLSLVGNEMRDPFHAQANFANLKNLEILDLRENLLSGPLFAEDFINLKNLKVLGLNNNLLDGYLPAQGLCEMRKLVELDLSWNFFTGNMPKCIGNLSNLQVLDLTTNKLSGNFPSFISNLTSLIFFSLIGNGNIHGSFSLSALANHSKLEILHLATQSSMLQVETENPQWHPTFQLKSIILRRSNLNKNSGSKIPSFLMFQNDLHFVDLSHNNLVGTFPSWLMQNNSRLEGFSLKNNSFVGQIHLFSSNAEMIYLDISKNKFSGLLPQDIGLSVQNLTYMNLSMNSFEGNIPSSIGEMKELTSLDLSHNHFSGEIPKYLATNCISLMYLKLSNNFLQGQIIPKSSRWTMLRYLYLNNNNFSGKIEEELAHNTYLHYLDVSNNSISGKIPSSIWNCSLLTVLLMAENQLEGQIPSGLSNLTNLQILDLSHNKLSGLEPNLNFSSLVYLKFLYLEKNALSGSIPITLSESSWLVTLDLRDNRFSGSIPLWINKLSKLRVLLLGGNYFQGQIPIELCQLKNISIMDLSKNRFSGLIPSCIANLTFGMAEYDGLSFQISDTRGTEYTRFVFFNLNTSLQLNGFLLSSFLQDEVRVEVEFRTKSNYYSYGGKILNNMTGLDLSSNELTDTIPPQIGYHQQMHSLNLSHNSLSGSIPNTLSNLTQIESLDLSYNNLTGEIPSQLSQLYYLAIFNVSYNNLSGMPPSSGQFANFDENNYRGNPNLCGPFIRSCEETVPSPVTQSDGESKESAIDMEAFSWSFAGAYVTILLGFVIVLCINVQWRRAWFYLVDKFVPTRFYVLLRNV